MVVLGSCTIDLVVERFSSMFKNLPATILVICRSSIVFNSPPMLVPQVFGDPTLSCDFPIIRQVVQQVTAHSAQAR